MVNNWIIGIFFFSSMLNTFTVTVTKEVYALLLKELPTFKAKQTNVKGCHFDMSKYALEKSYFRF